MELDYGWIDVSVVGDRYRRELDPYSGVERGGDKPRWPGDLPLSWNGAEPARPYSEEP